MQEKYEPVARDALTAEERDTYEDLLAVFPHAELEREATTGNIRGVLRFKTNGIIRWLVDSGHVSLNNLSVDVDGGRFTIDDHMEFYQGLGYSLGGFLEIFGEEVARRFEKLQTPQRLAHEAMVALEVWALSQQHPRLPDALAKQIHTALETSARSTDD